MRPNVCEPLFVLELPVTSPVSSELLADGCQGECAGDKYISVAWLLW